MTIKRTFMVCSCVVIAVICALLCALQGYAAEVGFIKYGESAADFKLYDMSHNLFEDEVPLTILDYNKRYDYNKGMVRDPVTGSSCAVTDGEWYARVESAEDGAPYVYIPTFNPSFPFDVAGVDQGGAAWHNALYLYSGFPEAGMYLIRSGDIYVDDADHTYLTADPKCFKLLAQVADVDPETGSLVPGTIKYYGYPNDPLITVGEGQKLTVYYQFYNWEFETKHALGIRYTFAQRPQLFRLEDVTPVDVTTKQETWEQLLADLRWEGYQDGYGTGYEVGYDAGYSLAESFYLEGYWSGYYTGYTLGENEGYDTGFMGGYDVGYDAGYDVGNMEGMEEGYILGNEAGYKRGVSELDTAGGAVGNFLESTWDIVVDAVTTISEGTTINGISILGILFTCLGIAVVVVVLRLIRR